MNHGGKETGRGRRYSNKDGKGHEEKVGRRQDNMIEIYYHVSYEANVLPPGGGNRRGLSPLPL
jgi:hypothetical protein